MSDLIHTRSLNLSILLSNYAIKIRLFYKTLYYIDFFIPQNQLNNKKGRIFQHIAVRFSLAYILFFQIAVAISLS